MKKKPLLFSNRRYTAIFYIRRVFKKYITHMAAYFSRLLPVKIRQPSRHTSARFQSFRMFEILELVAPEFCHLTSCRRFRGAFFSGRFHFLFRLRLIIAAQRFPFIILNIKLVLRRRRQFIIFLCFVFFFYYHY